MSRPFLLLLIILLVIIGGLWFLSTLDTEKPLTRVEKTIPSDKLAK